MSVIEIRDVTKAFGERQVLEGVDLSVAEHEAIALIGASGSGVRCSTRVCQAMSCASLRRK